MKILQQISIREKLSSLIIASSAFLLMGTMTALWSNPYFIRMTEENVWDYLILSVEALLIGLFFGIRAPRCATKKAGIGGILGFFGFGSSMALQFFDKYMYVCVLHIRTKARYQGRKHFVKFYQYLPIFLLKEKGIL